MSDTPLIHVVDDDESLRNSLLRLLRAAGFEACGYGSTGEFLLNPLPDRPGCVLLDLRLPGPSGLELQAALHRQGVDAAGDLPDRPRRRGVERAGDAGRRRGLPDQAGPA